jgi:XTP/dITP diphosphohydrolase
VKDEDIMKKRTTLVIATGNRGKLAEIRALLSGFSVDLKDLEDFGPVPPIIEDGATFDDNAYKKASVTARILGLPTLADDSGLVVKALNGAPGVYSARYAGEDATDAQRCAKILEEMDGKTDRGAAFECVISIAVPSGPALTYEGRCEGVIAQAPRGTNGFGYDPIFHFPSLDKTFGELSQEDKGRISHRGEALRELRDEFDKVLVWIDQQMKRS